MTTSATTAPQMPSGLPPLEPELHERLNQHIAALIHLIQDQEDGFLPFDEFMHHCLYAPRWGYYTAGSIKFASQTPNGDFTTAPELSPLFGHSVAQQVAEVLRQCPADTPPTILEFGAGTGALAQAVLLALGDQFPGLRYQILELSPTLQARQRKRLAAFAEQVQWLDRLPQDWVGCVLANEVVDAMPVSLVERDEQGRILEWGVRFQPQAQGPVPFIWAQRPADPSLSQLAQQRLPEQAGFLTEINLRAEAWIHAMGDWLKQGAALIIDYGFPQHEYYHPQRAQGTLMCHFRHHAHDQPLIYPGLQDITAHVDFTALADAALAAQLEVYGYTSQANFLFNTGYPQLLEVAHRDLNPDQNPQYLPQWTQLVSASQKLLNESEMGELFKVLAIGRGLEPPLLGFIHGDRRDRL